MLPPDLVVNAERRRRFVQEAQLASALQHPHIVTMFDIGSADGCDYLAMELVKGRPLDKAIPQKGLRLTDASDMRRRSPTRWRPHTPPASCIVI